MWYSQKEQRLLLKKQKKKIDSNWEHVNKNRTESSNVEQLIYNFDPNIQQFVEKLEKCKKKTTKTNVVSWI